jgi:hypothetical protein
LSYLGCDEREPRGHSGLEYTKKESQGQGFTEIGNCCKTAEDLIEKVRLKPNRNNISATYHPPDYDTKSGILGKRQPL